MNKVLKSFAVLTVAISFLFSTAVFAAAEDDIVINYSGTVVIPPCSIDTPQVSVDFGNIAPAMLGTTGSTTEWKSFNIQLSNCTGVNSVDMNMSGPPSIDPKYYATTGTAQNVEVEISDPAGINYSNGKVVEYTGDITNITFVLQARLRNNGNGAATPGNLSSVITATFTYK